MPLPQLSRTSLLLGGIILLYLLGVVLGPTSPIPLSGGTNTLGQDYVNIWAAARLTVSDDITALYDLAQYNLFLRSHISPQFETHNWSYSPLLQLWIWPFAFIPYELGYILWLMASFAVFYAGARQFHTHSREMLFLLFSGAGIWVILTGQNGFLTSGLLLLGLGLRQRNIMASSCCFALLVIKPHLGLLIPFFLLYERNWRVLLLTPAILALLGSITLFLWGTAPWIAYFTVTPDIQWHIFTDWHGAFQYMMPSVLMALRLWDVPFATAAWIQAAYSLYIVGYLFWGIRQCRLEHARLVLLLLCTLAMLPYGFVYDMLPYHMALLLWWKDTHPQQLSPFAQGQEPDRWQLLLWLWPLASFALAFATNLQCTPFLYLLLLHQWRKAQQP